MKKVFISYVHEDSELVSRLCDEFQRHDIDIWIDKESLHPGQFWPDVIRKAIREGEYFIACFSTNYLQKIKSYMNEELTVAIEELRKRPRNSQWFIPLLLSGEMPDIDIGGGKSIRDIQCLQLDSDHWEDSIKILIKVLSSKELTLNKPNHKIQHKKENVNSTSEDINLLTWEEWRDKRFLLTVPCSLLICLLIIVISSILISIGIYNGSSFRIFTGICTGLFLVYLFCMFRHVVYLSEKNKYLIYCAKVFFEESNWSKSAGCLLEVTRGNVNKEIAKDFCLLIASKADEFGEHVIADQLYRVAKERWGNK